MHNLLTKLLQKKNLNVEMLDKEEKETFENWDRVLSKKELTIEDIKKFLENQIGIIEQKWKDYNLTDKRKAELIPYHTVYKTLLAAISSPTNERSAMEQYLTQQINTITK